MPYRPTNHRLSVSKSMVGTPINGARRSLALLFLAYAAVVLGCRDNRPENMNVSVRDSAGIRIVESRGPILPSGTWTIDGGARLRIGIREGDSSDALYRVVGATRLSTGRIVVAERGS
jgi:hypothetical protein